MLRGAVIVFDIKLQERRRFVCAAFVDVYGRCTRNMKRNEEVPEGEGLADKRWVAELNVGSVIIVKMLDP